MTFENKKEECRQFMKFLGDENNIGSLPTESLVKGLAIIWSNTERDSS